MEWKVYEPKAKQRSEERLSITKHRNFVLNRAATDRLRTNKSVRLHYTTDGRVGIEPVKDGGENVLTIHYAPGGNICTVAASGFLQQMRYHKTLPKLIYYLCWNKKQSRLEFQIPAKYLHGRRRRRKRGG